MFMVRWEKNVKTRGPNVKLIYDTKKHSTKDVVACAPRTGAKSGTVSDCDTMQCCKRKEKEYPGLPSQPEN